MIVKRDWQQLLDGIEAELRQRVQDMIDGAADDLDGPIRQASAQITLAIKRDRPELAAEARDTLELYVLSQQVRVEFQAEGMLTMVLDILVGSLITGASAGLRSLTVA